MKLLKYVLLSIVFSTNAFSDNANSDDELGGTLDFTELELEQINTPDLPSAVLPDIFKELNTEAQPAIEQEEAELPATQDIQPTDTNSNDVKVNIVEINETFFNLVLNEETNSYQRSLTTEARPGDLIELVVSAINMSDQTVTDVEMVNSIPSGPVELLPDSFKIDKTRSLYRISRNGETFFPAEAELQSSEIKFVQWLIFSLEPGETITLSYRIKIKK